MSAATKLLLVEDSKFLRIDGERALSKAGYTVISASDGEEALRLANEQHPDVILLDMLLPKLSGLNVLKALKLDPETSEIPVIIVSSLSQANAEKLVAEGAIAYFEKSALALDKSSDKLAATVERVLDQFGHRKEVTNRLHEVATKKSAGC